MCKTCLYNEILKKYKTSIKTPGAKLWTMKSDLASYLFCQVKNKTYGIDPKDGGSRDLQLEKVKKVDPP